MFQKIKNILKKCNENIIPLLILVPFLEIPVIECLHRRSISEGIAFIMESPQVYLINVLLLMAMLALSLIFRERLFWAFFISLLWLILGIINFFILGNRISPFSFADIKVFSSVASIIRQYMGFKQIFISVLALIAGIGISVYFRIRVPKINRKAHIIRDASAFIIMIGLGVLACFWGQKSFRHTGNITLTYLKSGFVYCFSDSVIDSGIRMPLGYSENEIGKLETELSTYNVGARKETEKKPNIIFVQLESVFDACNMKDYAFSEDPMPFFHKIEKKYTSGFVEVPAFGAGTVNTEFEILTGMSMDYFGLCEYPYKTILKKQTCESLAYNLQEEGYKTAVIHDNRGTFYSRNQVFKNLGFDTFEPVEYMTGMEYNQIDWVKDKILPGEIIKCIKSTDEPDFIYTITVQSHGKYPTTAPEEPYPITLYGEDDPERKNAFEYYVNECHDVDNFMKELVTEVEDLGEDCVIVFFGDHLPTLEIEDSELKKQNTYQTTYIIWDNIGLDRKNRDLTSYQLASDVMAKLGYHNGVLARFHQIYRKKPNYQSKLAMLQYDMLYGEKYIYGGVNRYEKSHLTYGLYPITIDDVIIFKDVVYIKGENFTEASQIYINGHKQKTRFVSPSVLVANDSELQEHDRIRVRQITDTGGKIGSTDEWIYHEEINPEDLIETENDHE